MICPGASSLPLLFASLAVSAADLQYEGGGVCVLLLLLSVHVLNFLLWIYPFSPSPLDDRYRPPLVQFSWPHLLSDRLQGKATTYFVSFKCVANYKLPGKKGNRPLCL